MERSNKRGCGKKGHPRKDREGTTCQHERERIKAKKNNKYISCWVTWRAPADKRMEEWTLKGQQQHQQRVRKKLKGQEFKQMGDEIGGKRRKN